MPVYKFALVFALSGLLAPEAESRRQAGEGRLIEHLKAASQSEDPVDRANQRSGVFFKARDFRRVLIETAAGLQHDSQALELLLRSASAELWLGDGERALDWTRRLEVAVDHAELDAEARSSWLRAVEDYETRAEALLKLEAKGRESLSRAHLTVGLFALVATGLIALLVSKRRDTSAPERI